MNSITRRTVADTFTSVTRSFPFLRTLMWNQMYQLISGLYRHPGWTFMNYGFAHLDPADTAAALPQLAPEDESDRSFIQLYHHTLHRVDMSGADVLEVGCGRGGGCAYVARYHRPRSVCGVDLSRTAVRFCRRKHRLENLMFRVGDSGRLPFRDGSFNAVVNIESSHCYPSLDRFFSEVRRILRPGGSFHIADIWDDVRVDAFHGALKRSGMRIEAGGDITRNVFEAMKTDGRRRVAFFRTSLLSPLVRFFQEFAGNEESAIHRKFRENRIFYYSYLLRKA